MDINDAFPSNYLKASDLHGAEPVVTIAHVDLEEVGRKRERKAVIYFKGKEKGLILNKTNATKIMQITGSGITEEWEGHQIKLYPTETEFGGETVECIRVKSVTKEKMAPMTKTNGRASKPVVADEADLHTADVDEDSIPF